MAPITVLGAGVVGLSTAIRLQEQGHTVTIIAEDKPGDEKSTRYTSPWAGAHHVSLAGSDTRQQKLDRDTFDVMWAMSASDQPTEHLFMRIQESEYYVDTVSKDGQRQWEFMPGFRVLVGDELPKGTVTGFTFETLTIDTPVYLEYLLSQFILKGGNFIRAKVQHIDQLAEPCFGVATPPEAIVICAGIGARALGGVEDKDVYPIRGQTVLIKAPWVNFGRSASGTDGFWTYIIPRRSGDVILGGIRDANDWFPHPRKETTDNILERAFKLAPDLAPPEITVQREATVDDLRPLIIEEGCGFRPGRHGGIRLESVEHITGVSRKIPVVFNYGHGGYGFQSSWGSAKVAAELLEDALRGVYRIVPAMIGSGEQAGPTHH